MKTTLLCLALVGCSPSSQTKALTTTLLTVQAAEVGWQSFDKARWNEVATTCTAVDCAARNTEVKKMEAEVDPVRLAAFTALRDAYKLQGDQTLAGAEAAAADLVKLLIGLGVKGI